MHVESLRIRNPYEHQAITCMRAWLQSPHACMHAALIVKLKPHMNLALFADPC